MKRLRQLLVALSLMVIGVQVAQAQVKLGDNPGTIDANALLELESTSKGFLLPRMSTVQRLAISSPSEGMMVYDMTASCTYIYRDVTRQWYSLCAADSLTASNGLTKVGRDIQLGGTLTQATNIAQAGNNLNITGAGSLGVGTNAPNAGTRADIEAASGTTDPLRLGGLRGGLTTDSIMTVDATSGILRKRSLADVLQYQEDFVWKLDGNLTTAVRSLGTKSNYALPIITNNVERMRIAATGEVGIGTNAPTNRLTVEAAADPLKLVGLQTAAQTDSLLTVDFATGVVRKITIDSVASRGIVAENAITKEGNIVRLGGNLNRATTIGASGANTIAITGLQTAAMTDSLITQDAATGILRKITIDSVASRGIVAENAITKEGNIVRLGGNLNRATTIGASGANTIAITGLQTAAMTDSLITQDAATGILRKITIDSVASRGIVAENAITKQGNIVRLGGNLNRATTIGASGANTIAITGLQTAAMTDSLITQDAATGILRKITIDSVASRGMVAENAITKEGNIVRLGGNLNRATTIGASGANTIAITGLQTAAMTDSLITQDAATGILRKITIDSVASRGIVAENAITKQGNIVRLGGNLNRATTIGASGANTIAITGLQTAAMTDSLITQDAATGILRKITIDSVASRGIVAENGVNKEGNIVRLGGTLNRTTTVAQATNDFAFTGGKVGVGAATPNSTLQVGGSVAVPISAKSSAYTISVDDHTIIGDCTSGGFTLTLPAASSCAGRTYIIIKGDATGNVLTFSSAIRLSLSQTMPSVNYNVRLHVQSDGTDWWLVARF